MNPLRSMLVPAILCSLLGAAGAQTPAHTSPAAPATPAAGPTEPPPPAHPATPEQVREYLSVIKSSENAQKALEQMESMSRANSPSYLPSAFWDDLQKSFASIDVTPSMIPVYQRFFSEEDMKAIVAFYKTPAGQHLVFNQPLAAAGAGDLLRKEANRVGQEVFARHKAEIEAAQKANQPGPSPSTPSTPTPAPAPQP